MSNGVTDNNKLSIKGFLKIKDVTDENNPIIIRDLTNSIHYENISISMAQCLSSQGTGWISEMVFGNGGTIVDPTGLISYLTPNTIGINTGLYNQTYKKRVDRDLVFNNDITRNKMEIRHISGATYTDILISCLLDYGEPVDQEAFDNSQTTQGNYIFDELGLRSYDSGGNGRLLTHVVFHPVQKSLNRLLRIDYTIRIQSLTGEV